MNNDKYPILDKFGSSVVIFFFFFKTPFMDLSPQDTFITRCLSMRDTEVRGISQHSYLKLPYPEANTVKLKTLTCCMTVLIYKGWMQVAELVIPPLLLKISDHCDWRIVSERGGAYQTMLMNIDDSIDAWESWQHTAMKLLDDGVWFLKVHNLCDVIKQNQSEVRNIDFEI